MLVNTVNTQDLLQELPFLSSSCLFLLPHHFLHHPLPVVTHPTLRAALEPSPAIRE